jgi:hypothetical protein
VDRDIRYKIPNWRALTIVKERLKRDLYLTLFRNVNSRGITGEYGHYLRVDRDIRYKIPNWRALTIVKERLKR